MTLNLMQFKPLEAPDIYYFKDPDTNRLFRATTKHEMIKRVVDYRAQNELEPLEYLGVVIDAYMCSLPRYRYKCESTTLVSRSLFGYLQGGVALIKNLFYGKDNMVNKDQADLRAAQCVKCPYNVFPDRGAFLKWSDEIAEASTHGRRSEHYDKLGSCSVCSCPLKAKVWYKRSGDKFSKKEMESFEQVNCWQIK